MVAEGIDPRQLVARAGDRCIGWCLLSSLGAVFVQLVCPPFFCVVAPVFFALLRRLLLSTISITKASRASALDRM